MWSVIATWAFSEKAVYHAARRLEGGGSALDVVVEAVRIVENDPEVDSVGTGGFLNAEGKLEADAAIMDGRTLAIGAVGALRFSRNPISVARDVMEKSKHAMLVGAGARAFAAQYGHKKARLETEAARAKWREVVRTKASGTHSHDTVGVVVRSNDGALCVGTSTSGAGLKLPGRVGDSPLVGSGFYADEDWGGAAATGLGETIMRGVMSYQAVEYLKAGYPPDEAANKVVLDLHTRLLSRGVEPGNMAIVCMDRQGRFGGAANHQGFAYVAASQTQSPFVCSVAPIIERVSSNTRLETINNIEV